jgi:hypothetical protein
MTVPEPTPDRAPRGPLLRRACFVVSALALTAAFALSLSGIATTRGAVRPNGQAAAIAAQQRSISSESGADGFSGRHHCRHGDRSRDGSSPSGRV